MCQQKKAVVINDISGIGRCSVTVACPLLSSAGVETCVLPTALLSTHTGGFVGYSFLDLGDEMKKIIGHWSTLGLSFDAIYSGYLGSPEQMETVRGFIDRFKTENTFVMVDPVMGDSGVFYKGIDFKYVDGMKKLCKSADVIVPNMTEVSFLLGTDCASGPYSEKQLKELLKRLCGEICGKSVVTGIYFNDKEIGAASFDSGSGDFNVSMAPRIEGFYHGTGDVFASCLLACILNGKTLAEAMEISVSFTESAIIRTRDAGTDTRYGVLFEKSIPDLIRVLGL